MKKKAIVSVLAFWLVCLLLACTGRTLTIALAPEVGDVYRPRFVVADSSRVGLVPSYDRVTVYELRNFCDVPGCPIVWQVAVSSTASPTELQYGVLPGFGSLTIVGAKPLQAGRGYRLVLDDVQVRPQSQSTSIDFTITEDGTVAAGSSLDN